MRLNLLPILFFLLYTPRFLPCRRCSAYSIRRTLMQIRPGATQRELPNKSPIVASAPQNKDNQRRWWDNASMMHREDVFKIFPTLASVALLPCVASAETLPSVVPPSGQQQQQQQQKPWAPTEALLPATRVRLLLNQAIDLAEKLASITLSSSSSSSSSNNYSSKQTQDIQNILAQLDALLVPPARINDLKPNKSIRLAFNTYTSYLRYDDKFTLTGSSSDKKRMIREDRVPDVKLVITADLDLRDLYRNEVLTNVDEARAELRYQMDQFQKVTIDGGGGSVVAVVGGVDGEELYRLLRGAGDACDEWFKLIAEENVNEALDIVLSAGQ